MLLVLDLVEKGLVTDQVVLTVGYDIENLTDPVRRKAYQGEVTIDRYGRRIPKHAHGTANMGCETSSTEWITRRVMELFDEIVDPALLVRRINLSANHLVAEQSVAEKTTYEQLELFADDNDAQREEDKEDREREKNIQKAMIDIKKKYGKNAILRGMNLEEGATAKDRNSQIGGHRA